MSCCVVSSAFLGVRRDRKDSYYTDNLDVLYRSGLPVRIFSQSQICSRSISIAKGDVVIADPERLLLEFWPERDWRAVYAGLLAGNRVSCGRAQASFPLLIAVWLSKFVIIRRVLEEFDSVVWVDAGYVNKLYNHFCAGLIGRRELSRSSSLGAAVGGFGPVLLNGVPWRRDCLHVPDGVMFGYPNSRPISYKGAFMFVRREFFGGFYEGVRERWLRLIGDGVAGTEENALTLFGWDFGVPYLGYDGWVGLL